ncbi:DsrE/DsrF/DrsH-like family protein [Novipirellula herctigrandis]
MTDLLAETTVDRTAELARRVDALERRLTSKENTLSLVVFSNEFDKLMAAFTIATGAAACGMKVSMFFTFWATAALKKQGRQAGGKSIVERMFGWILPGGFKKQKLSKLDMAGMGRWMMGREMDRKNIASLEELVASADELGVQIGVCEMAMSLMGIRPEELINYSDLDYCGVATMLDRSSESNTTLFI